jgi:hypothetical protein
MFIKKFIDRKSASHEAAEEELKDCYCGESYIIIYLSVITSL